MTDPSSVTAADAFQRPAAEETSVAGEWRRGWTSVVGSMAGMCTGINMFTNICGFFVKPMTEALGWRREQVAMAFATVVMSALFLPFAGAIADRRGVRILAAAGALVFTGCYAALALMPGDYWQYLAVLAVIGALGAPCTSPVIFSRAVVVSFERSRGLALGICMCGVPLAATVIVPVLQHVIATFGWRAGFWFLAPVTAALGFAAFKLFGLAPHKPRTARAADDQTSLPRGADLSLRQGLLDARFWMLTVAMVAASVTAAVVVGSLQPMLSDKGVSGQTAAFLGVWYLVGLIAGRLTIGILLDRFKAHVVAGVALAAPLVGLLIFLVAGTQVALWGLGIIFIASAAGAEFDIMSYLTARYFGLRAFGALIGVLGGFISLAFAVGGVATGRTFDLFGNYDYALIASAALSAIAGLIIFMSGFVRRA